MNRKLTRYTLFSAILPLLACQGDRGADGFAADTLDGGPAPAAAPVGAAEAARLIEVELVNREGQRIGTAQISEEGEGVRMTVQVSNLPPGRKGIHLHQVGQCEPPDFQSAGGHFAPMGRQHGLENPQGPHAGDMSNLEVDADGTVNMTIDNPRVTLREGQPNSLLDADGTALVIHADEDDQRTDPSGNSGDRIACGILRRS